VRILFGDTFLILIFQGEERGERRGAGVLHGIISEENTKIRSTRARVA
jgi:hypothetical protein